MYEPKLIKFYVHNYVILYSEIFYMRFYDFSSHTILAVILRFLYGQIRVRSYDFTIRFFETPSDSCQNSDFDNLARVGYLVHVLHHSHIGGTHY